MLFLKLTSFWEKTSDSRLHQPPRPKKKRENSVYISHILFVSREMSLTAIKFVSRQLNLSFTEIYILYTSISLTMQDKLLLCATVLRSSILTIK